MFDFISVLMKKTLTNFKRGVLTRFEHIMATQNNKLRSGVLKLIKDNNANVTKKRKHDEFQRHSYKHDFAIFSKSFVRDLDRSLNSYRSFEEHFTEKDIPYFIIVPERDVLEFTKKFEDAKTDGTISKIPEIYDNIRYD